MAKVCLRFVTVFGAVMLVGLSSHANHIAPQIACPNGYAKVPGNIELETTDFCVMKFEAKAWKEMSGEGHFDGYVDPGEIKANGCDGTGNSCDGGAHNWGLADHKPVSVGQGIPWRRISRDNAIAECQSLGQGYDLISNREWQTIARDIELQSENWSGQLVGAGCVSQGNAGSKSECSYTSRGPERGGDAKASHTLSSGEEIYHFSGNVWEWVKDNNTSKQGINGYISTVTGTNVKYGPQGSYKCTFQNNNCGFGYGYLDYAGGAVLRGGGWYDYDRAGVFAAYLSFGPSYSNVGVGFRCVLRSQSNGGTLGGGYE